MHVWKYLFSSHNTYSLSKIWFTITTEYLLLETPRLLNCYRLQAVFDIVVPVLWTSQKHMFFKRCSTSSSSKSIASLLLVPTDVIHLYPIFFWNTFLPYISPWFYKAYFESVLVHILSKNVTSPWIKFVYTLFYRTCWPTFLPKFLDLIFEPIYIYLFKTMLINVDLHFIVFSNLDQPLI